MRLRRVEIFDNIYSDKTKKYEKTPIGTGLFHAWGMDYEEFENGPGVFSTAIVECDNGSIINTPSEYIRFIDGDPIQESDVVVEMSRIIVELEHEAIQLRERRKAAVLLCQEYKDKLDAKSCE